MSPVLKSLASEKTFVVKRSTRLPFPLDNGSVRLVDSKGQTVALVLDKATLDEINEDLEASSPDFIASLAASRASGRVAGAAIKSRLGLK